MAGAAIKACPDDKILNPITSRCVKKDGKIGRQVMEGMKVQNKVTREQEKYCPDDKILNTATNRCVLKSGAIGRKLLLTGAVKTVKSDNAKKAVSAAPKRVKASKAIRFYEPKQPYYEFSNFYLSPFKLDGVKWPTTEHYFQAAKFKDVGYREIIRSANTPNKAFILANQKKKGGYIGNWKLNPTDKRTLNELIDAHKHVKLRADWDDVKLQVMKRCLKAKFVQNEDLKNLLLSTGGSEIIEDSPRDSYWGVGKDGKGENHLGLLLMELRKELGK